jgi:hypothetical protein
VRPLELATQRAEVATLKRQTDELENEKRELESRKAETCGQLAGSRKRMRSLDALTALFKRYRLSIVEDCPAGEKHEAKLPTAMAEATKRLMGESQGQPGQVRCIHFVGRYMDVLAALEELAGDESPAAVPVGLSMSEANVESELREWTLMVWL